MTTNTNTNKTTANRPALFVSDALAWAAALRAEERAEREAARGFELAMATSSALPVIRRRGSAQTLRYAAIRRAGRLAAAASKIDDAIEDAVRWAKAAPGGLASYFPTPGGRGAVAQQPAQIMTTIGAMPLVTVKRAAIIVEALAGFRLWISTSTGRAVQWRIPRWVQLERPDYVGQILAFGLLEGGMLRDVRDHLWSLPVHLDPALLSQIGAPVRAAGRLPAVDGETPIEDLAARRALDGERGVVASMDAGKAAPPAFDPQELADALATAQTYGFRAPPPGLTADEIQTHWAQLRVEARAIIARLAPAWVHDVSGRADAIRNRANRAEMIEALRITASALRRMERGLSWPPKDIQARAARRYGVKALGDNPLRVVNRLMRAATKRKAPVSVAALMTGA